MSRGRVGADEKSKELGTWMAMNKSCVSACFFCPPGSEAELGAARWLVQTTSGFVLEEGLCVG